jgi:flagellar hook-associated protein 3 FlgL
VQQETRVTITTTAQKAFISDTNVFDVLRDLRNALRDNDREGIQQSLPGLDRALSKVVSERAYVGTSLKQLESAEGVLTDFGYTTEELLSNVEDTDMADALTRLTMLRIAYEATLKSTSMVTELSLVNYV